MQTEPPCAGRLKFFDSFDPYMTHHAEILLKANKIKAIPDWRKAFRTDFLKKAMA